MLLSQKKKKRRTSNKQLVTALPHQKQVIDDLLAIHPTQRGLVLAHQMGGGKTLTALMLMNNFADSPHIILCPAFLAHIYEMESRTRLRKSLPKNTRIITYEQFPSMFVPYKEPIFLNDCILIADEAHYLIPMLSALEKTEQENLVLALMNRPLKTLMMTGTPIYNSIFDLRYLVNIAAGKEILPFRDADFNRAFMKPRWLNVFFSGFVVSALTSGWTRLVYVASMLYLTSQNWKKFEEYLKLPREQKYLNFLDPMSTSPKFNFLQKILKNLQHRKVTEDHANIYLKNFLDVSTRSHVTDEEHETHNLVYSFFESANKEMQDGETDPYKFLFNALKIEDFKGETPTEASKKETGFTESLKSATEALKQKGFDMNSPDSLTKVVDTTFDPVSPVFAKMPMWMQYLSDDNNREMIWIYLSIMAAGILVILLTCLRWLRDRLSNSEMAYASIDYRKLKDALSPFYSSFELPHGSFGIPKRIEKVVFLSYDAYQTRIWTRMTYNLLSDQDLLDLGIVRNDLVLEESLGSTLPKQFTKDSYESVGRMISNASPEDAFPEKFHLCFDRIAAQAGTRAVVYSDFLRGQTRFLEFLAVKQLRHTWLRFDVVPKDSSPEIIQSTVDRFNNNLLDIVVLGAGMYEGISFKATNQMHILDVPLTFKSYDQLMGRVVRLYSHQNLPKEQQKVTFYTYVTSLNPSMFQVMTSGLKRLSNYFSYVDEFWKIYKSVQGWKKTLPGSFNPSVLESTSPEAIVWARIQPLKEFVIRMKQMLRPQGTAKETLFLSCCPSYEDDHPAETCSRFLPPCHLYQKKSTFKKKP